MKWWPHRHVLILLPVAPNDVVALQHKTPRQVARDEASSAGDAYAQLAGGPVGLSPVDSVNRETRGSHVERCAAKMRLQGCPQRLVQNNKKDHGPSVGTSLRSECPGCAPFSPVPQLFSSYRCALFGHVCQKAKKFVVQVPGKLFSTFCVFGTTPPDGARPNGPPQRCGSG